ncbi:DUF1272 domain-containing protein [Acinetobacter sp. ANC 5383]
MLELRPNCECCNADLAVDSKEVLICSFECTFCLLCSEQIFNFSGELVRRPIRPENKLQKYPASTQRVFNPNLKNR